MSTITKETLRAFLTPIAFFRAIGGSYTLDNISSLAYRKTLTGNEWQALVHLYEINLSEEYVRNTEQRARHISIQKKLAPTIKQLRSIVQTIPEIKDVLLVNSYSLGALKPSSDIDVVVICEPKLLWLARIKLTAALEKTGIRRKPGHIEEHICLSFFITTDSLDIKSIALPDDLYLYFWLSSVIPLFGKHHSTWVQDNKWIQTYLPHIKVSKLPPTKNKKFSFLSYIANGLVRIPMYQRAKYKAQKLGPESSIVISDTMLKFHNQDRRQLYKDKTWVELAALEQLFSTHHQSDSFLLIPS